MEMTADRIIAVLLFILGLGVTIGLDPKSKGELFFATACFGVSGIILYVSVGVWALTTKSSLLRRSTISALFFVLIGISMVEAIRWARSKYHPPGIASTDQSEQPTPKHGEPKTEPQRNDSRPKDQRREKAPDAVKPGTSLGHTEDGHRPLAVEFKIGPKKIIIVQNNGRTIKDVGIRLTKYTLNREAFNDNRRIVIDSFSQFGAHERIAEILPDRQGSWDVMAIQPMYAFYQFPNPSNSNTLPLDFYGIRFTFRDGETGKHYVYYRVTSILYDDPRVADDPDRVGTGGPPSVASMVHDNITPVIIAQERTLYRTAPDEEYVAP